MLPKQAPGRDRTCSAGVGARPLARPGVSEASRDEAQELREPVQLLLAAAQCLSLVSEAEAAASPGRSVPSREDNEPCKAEETARMALAILRLRPTTASVDELQEAFGELWQRRGNFRASYATDA